MPQADLYNDLHPDKSLKNTGFKDHNTAIKTIKMISKRSLRYQFDVINTMYNRAKYHPHITNDMKDAMAIFKKWLKNYSKLKNQEDKKYPWLSLKTIAKYEKIAELYGVSMVARGLKRGTRTDEGFLKMYKKVGGKANKLQYIPVKKDNMAGQDYYSYRISFLNSRMGQIKHGHTPLYYTEGKFKGLPTKQHIILIMHAYSPDKNIYKNIYKKGGGITLYHGSPFHMEELEVRTPRGDNDFNRQTGVYMTSDMIEAMLYSMARDKERINKGWGVINGILYLRCDLWTGDNPKFKLNEIGYLHEIITDDAEKNPYNETEYIVKHNIKPDKITEIKFDMIKQYIKYVTREKFYDL